MGHFVETNTSWRRGMQSPIPAGNRRNASDAGMRESMAWATPRWLVWMELQALLRLWLEWAEIPNEAFIRKLRPEGPTLAYSSRILRLYEAKMREHQWLDLPCLFAEPGEVIMELKQDMLDKRKNIRTLQSKILNRNIYISRHIYVILSATKYLNKYPYMSDDVQYPK